MTGLLDFVTRRSRSFLIGAALVIVLIVGLADYLTGFEIVFSVFYLMAVALAVWFVGKNFGVIISILSVVAWLAGDLAAGVHYAAPSAVVWNGVIVLAFYLVVVWLLSSLRSLHRQLEERVRQRTAALTQGMAERERLEKEIMEVSERERRRLGRDLHDSLCQHLTGTARRIDISRAERGGRVILTVEDDGIGLPETLQKNRGLGTRIMAHRAALIGGTFSIEPNPTGGTSVECSLPSPGENLPPPAQM